MALIPHQEDTVPAQLLVGSSEKALKQVITFLQKTFCDAGGCSTCASCRKIKKQQHHAIMWIRPEKKYTREQLVPLFNQLSFALDTDEQFFFVIEKADTLTLSCANSLLKSLEEPPPGYAFFLLAERLNGVVPTIRSRCTIHHLAPSASSFAQHPLFDFFTSRTFHDPLIFSKALDQSGITEQESNELLDALFAHWMGGYRSAVEKRKVHEASETQHALAIITHAYKHLPMPGSSKLFWKNLFLALKKPA